ncbi:hypothetical protein HNQ96_005684 [Aminobacter lissarensis]|uniref:Uncharacterized protein n=1 Tax=Aminobacter carboxidus TaxID=376165 RepID=A0A8E1WLP1_9HYPH|nr:hypothetical protein [Aminobacter lissarensis]MBB6469790.1 hypothetical protein [Aminobacter lissarensis]
MLTEDQTAAVAFLLNAATHRDANKVELIETHIPTSFLLESAPSR